MVTEFERVEKAEKRCKQCNKIINTEKGRSDRLYCDEICKNRYHNALNKEDSEEFKRVQKILRRNRKVLKKMYARNDRDTLKKERLLKEGFEFDYYTHTKISKIKSNLFIFCFEYGYRPAGDDKIKVVRAFDYKED